MNIDEKKLIEAITNSRSPVSLAELVRRFRIKSFDRRDFRNLLREMERQGKVARVRGKSYTAPTGKSGRIIGRLEVTSRGYGFVRPDWSSLKGKPPFEGDLFVPPRNLGNALDGDIVHAEFLRAEREGPIGRIEDVIEHAHKTIVGWYQQTRRGGGEVVPRNTRIERRISVPVPHADLEIKDFDWVVAEVEEFTADPHPLLGRIVSRLGSDEERGIDVLLVLRDRGIIEEFPASVEAEVKDLRFDWEKDLENRTDFRKLPTVTIDPETAKDYDDGLSIEDLPGGGWRLYVHIADVSHFLREGTALDREALERATSVYPVDRVVPMLPSKLSNHLCSLVPNEDRLTVTAVIEIDPQGRILRKEFHRSVIHSDFRLTYEEVQAFFDGDKERTARFQDLHPVLANLRQVAAALRKCRIDRGALDLDIPEVRIIFDENGAAKDISFYARFESHQLVEECMLIANEAVAQFLAGKEVPILFRVHETADEERLEKLEPALAVFGIRLTGRGGHITPFDIQKALAEAQKHPAGHILRRLVLRALRRAEYDPENVGHFGLASECYCHFTSPIRRYPDVVVHRQLCAIIEKKPLAYDREENDLDSLGEHTSSRERRAQEAEWESTKIKALEFMKQHEGDEFTAFVASVQTWGLFVELEVYPVEGFIKKAALQSDRYELDDTGVRLVGQRTGHVIKLGDKVRVRIDKVDPYAQQLDVTLLDQPESSRSHRSSKRRSY